MNSERPSCRLLIPALALLLTAAASALAQQAATQTAPQTAPTPGSPEAERERWNRVFTMKPPNIRTDANRFLVQVAANLTPGAAIDVGMGFGKWGVLAREYRSGCGLGAELGLVLPGLWLLRLSAAGRGRSSSRRGSPGARGGAPSRAAP